MGLKICCYCICKDEKRYFERWYSSAKEADYICILDTGSTDGTLDLLKNYPDIIYKQKIFKHFDFSSAKNEAFLLIPEDTDICVMFDLDEYLSPGWRNQLEKVYEGKAVGVIDFDADSVNRKMLAWPYIKKTKWLYPILETPYYLQNNIYHAFWDFSNYTFAEGIRLYHNRDFSKNRNNYDDFFQERLNQILNFKKRESTEELLRRLYDLIEWLPSSIPFELRCKILELKSILKKKEVLDSNLLYLNAMLCITLCLKDPCNDQKEYLLKIEQALQHEYDSEEKIIALATYLSCLLNSDEEKAISEAKTLINSISRIENSQDLFLLSKKIKILKDIDNNVHLKKFWGPIETQLLKSLHCLKTSGHFRPFTVKIKSI